MDHFKTMDNFSFTQQGIYFAQEKHPHSALFNVGGYALLKGNLNHTLLFETIQQQLECCDIIRDRRNYFKSDNPPGWDIFDMQFVDYSNRINSDKLCLEWMSADIKEGFEAASDLLKIRVLKAGDMHFYWYVKVHHILLDGYSMQLLFNNVIRSYNERYKNESSASGFKTPRFSDYVQEEQKYRTSSEYLTDKVFWKTKFDKYETNWVFQSCLNPDSNKDCLHATRYELPLPRKVFGEIENFCLKNRLTVSHYFIGVLCLLNKLYNNDSFVLGLPLYNRDNVRSKNTLGVFVKVLPFYVNFLAVASASFLELLTAIKKELSGYYRHKKYPLIDLLSSLNTREHLHNVIFSYQQNIYSERVNGEEATIKFLPSNQQQEDLQFHLLEYSKTEDLTIVIDCKTSSFSEYVIKKLITDFNHLIQNQFTQDSPCACITEPEKHQLLVEFNNTHAVYPNDKTIIDLFEEQAEKNPESIAFIVGEKEISYQVLNEKANQLAHYLREKYAVQPDDLVAILLERSEWMILSIIAILKSGAAYIPIDPHYPRERINYIIKDSKAKTVIDVEQLERFKEKQNKYDKSTSARVNHPGNLAYVIYTSGSTGQPKGCMLEQAGVVNRIDWMWHEYNFSSEDVILQKTAFTFDVSVWEIFLPLCWGAKMILCEKEDVGSPDRLLLIIEKHRVSCLHFVPSMLNTFIGSLFSSPDIAGRLKSVTKVITSGDALSAETVKKWYEKVSIPLHNLYGPTEASVDVTHYTTRKGDKKIPIGKPIWNTQLYILGKEEQLLPVGVIGELYIGGVGLAREYLNKPDLTAEKFVKNPFKEGERLYKTGDIARWLPDGNIEYLGRSDDQVKIRGHRIEAGEIESILNSHPAVETAMIIAKPNREGEKELVAYLVSKEKLNAHDLRVFLNSRLPAYMIPGFFIQLDSIPLNANGKADRKKLPDPKGLEIETGVEYIAPRNPTEEKIVRIWQQILEVEKIGVKDNFFDLGGHSLKAARLLNTIHKELNVKLELKDFFTKPRLEQQAALIQQSMRTPFIIIPPIAIQPHYALSSSQRRLWILSQFGEGAAAYNMPGVYVFEGILILEILEKSFHSLMERHESLRTSFNYDEEGELKQFISSASSTEFSIGYKDLREEEQQTEKLKEYIHSDYSIVFDLARAPLLKVHVYQLKENKWIITYVMHHIISDGWSMEIVVKELLLFYTSYIQQERENSITLDPAAIGLKPLRIQYKDYASWQQHQLRSGAMEAHKTYWLKQFSGELPILEMPTDKLRPLVKTSNGGILSKVISEDTSSKLKLLCQQNASTLFMGLFTTVTTLLYRYSGQEDIIIGSPITGRENADLEDQIGCYVNTLALRSQFKGSNSFLELLEQTKKTVLEAYEHQKYPFDELVNELNPQRDISRSPLFDVMVVVQNEGDYEVAGRKMEGIQIKSYKEEVNFASKFDLLFSFVEAKEELKLSIEYNTDIYNRSTIERLGNHLEQLIHAIIKSPLVPIRELDYLKEAEKEKLLYGFNKTEAAYPRDKTIVDLFEKQVEQTPDNIAVVFEEIQLTYKELNERANQLGRYLRVKYNIQPDDLVGVKLERSEQIIISLIGVLKSGGAYVPVDPDYPQERIAYIEKDCNNKVVIDSNELDTFYLVKENYSKNNLQKKSQPHNLAYVIYTSGTTGNPKGALLEHRNIVRLFFTERPLFDFNETDVWTLFHSYSFDFSVWEMYGALLYGGKLIVVPKLIAQSAPAFLELLRDKSVTVLNQTPSAFYNLNECERLHEKPDLKLRYIIFGGEALNPCRLSDWYYKYPKTKLVNMYGITETTVHVTYKEIGENEIKLEQSNIGQPIPTLSCFILDSLKQVVPIGVFGELYISGLGLARGYLNRPDLTLEKFISNPFREGERMYKTGDLGRWLPGGNIEYKGRIDAQVKIRGYRIELGEIESALQNYPSMDACLVVTRTNTNAEKELVAYLVSKTPLNISDIRHYLRNTLPAYMLPGYFIQLDALPLNANGKVDRKKLPLPEDSDVTVSVAYMAPRNETEAGLVKLWEEILQRKLIGVKDNFFDLGGNSLKATRLISQIHKRFNVELRIKDVFIEPTIEAIAAELATLAWVKEPQNVDPCNSNLESQIF